MLKSIVTNRKFTKPEMRVKIAKDVIAQIKAKAIKVLSGNGYVDLRQAVNGTDSFADQLDNKPCTVCALGAMFISDVKKDKSYVLPRENTKETTIFLDRPDVTSRLGKYFTPSQMDLIEDTFENDFWHKGKTFAEVLTDDSDDGVLTAICENIIQNNGIFKPKKIIEDYLKKHPEEAEDY